MRWSYTYWLQYWPLSIFYYYFECNVYSFRETHYSTMYTVEIVLPFNEMRNFSSPFGTNSATSLSTVLADLLFPLNYYPEFWYFCDRDDIYAVIVMIVVRFSNWWENGKEYIFIREEKKKTAALVIGRNSISTVWVFY